MTTTATDLSTQVWPGLTPRLLRNDRGPEDLADYTRAGGYQDLDDPDALLNEIAAARLLGRGGAAFPLAVKLQTVRAARLAGRPTVIVANGEEGEPASVKDRWLLRNRPHLVLDGLRLAARIVGADRAYVYVSDPQAATAVETALAALENAPAITVVTVSPAYIAGEESAAVRVINGGPAKPTDKPPRVFEEGVAGLPTLVSNVETLAHLPSILRDGANAFRSVGTEASPGTFLATVTGAGKAPVLYELPHGTTITDLLTLHGVSPDDVSGLLMGGYFAGLLGPDAVSAGLDHESLRALGSGLGCGAVAVLTTDCPVAVAASVLDYFDRENAGQCGSCFNGTAAMAAVTGALRAGTASAEDLTRLQRWSVVLRGRGACATLDGAANIAASLLSHFPDLVQAHLGGSCDSCRTFAERRPYEIEAIEAVEAR